MSTSSALRSELAENPLDESFSELDARSREATSNSANGLTIGPFRGFSLDQPKHDSQTLPNSPQPAVEPLFMDGLQTENISPSVESIGTLSDVHDFLDWPDLFDLDFTSNEGLCLTFSDTLEDTQRHISFDEAPAVQSTSNTIIPLQTNYSQANLASHPGMHGMNPSRGSTIRYVEPG